MNPNVLPTNIVMPVREDMSTLNGLLFPLSGNLAMPSLSCANALQIELQQKTTQMQVMETAYWSLKADFDKVCDVIKSMESAAKETKAKTQILGKKSTLQSIKEEDDGENAQNAETVIAKDKEIEQLKSELEKLKKENAERLEEMQRKNREANKRNGCLEKEIKNLKHRLKKSEKENKKLANLQALEEDKKEVKQNTLNQLYLSSKRIKEFMASMKKYRENYETLKKRQMNLIKCVGKEDDETMKIRMNDMYRDVVEAEEIHRSLYDALDVMKTESEGKELELITKDREYILLLEKEKFVSASHLDEYVKKNQTLQNNLTDREMKLRQTQNEVAFVKQKLNRMQNENGQLIEQLNAIYGYDYNPYI